MPDPGPINAPAGIPGSTLTLTNNFAFSDADVTDTHTVTSQFNTAASGVAVPLGTFVATEQNDTVNGSGGLTHWEYQVAADAVNALPHDTVRHEVFDVIVTDDQGGTATHQVAITIDGPPNNPPVIQNVGGVSVSVAEDGSVLLAAPSALVTDADNDTLTMTLHVGHGTLAPTTAILDAIANHTLTAIDTDGSDGTLSVSGSASAITAAIQAGTTYAPTSNYNQQDALDVAISDGHGGATQASVIINVTPVNDAPSGANKTVITNEDTGYVFQVADFGFSDPNDSPANALLAVKIATLPVAGSLTDNGSAVTAGQFVSVADITAGKLVFNPAANANGNGYASFTFQVQDNGGTPGVDLDQSPNTITVNVTPVNDAPSGADKTVITNEDTGYVFQVADFGFSDPNDSPANALLAVKIATLPVAGSLTDNGSAVTAGQFVSVADITAGKLVFNPAANANGNGYASFTFQVQDNGGTPGVDLDQSPNTITVNVTPVNDAPTVAHAIADQTATQGTPFTLQFAANTFNDVDIGDTLSYAAALSNGSALPSWLSFNATTRTFSGTPANSDVGTIAVKVTATDGSNASISDTFNIAVGNTNDAPVNTVPAGPLTVSEDTALALTSGNTISAHDVDGNLVSTQLSVLNGTLTVSLAGGASISAGASGSHALTLSGNETQINAALATLSYQGGPNFNGNDTLTVLSTDGGALADSDTVTINVTPVNDAPSGANKTVITNEDTGYVFQVADFGFSDPNDSPANALLAVKIATLPVAGSLTDNGSAVTAGQFVSVADITAGKLVFNPAANANGNGYASFTFQVQDNGGTPGVDLDQSPNTITVNVTPVNDAPSGADKTVITNEDTGYVFQVADFGFSDPNDSPANALLAVKIATLPVAGSLTDNGSAVTAGQFVSVADITAGKLVFNPAANANGNGYASFTFQVQDNGGTPGVDLDQSPNTITVNVTPVNDAPSGADKTVITNEDTGYIFQAADFGFSDPNDSPANALLAVKIATLPGAGSADRQWQCGDGGTVRRRLPTSRPASWCSTRPPMPTATATPASPSRCRTMAARQWRRSRPEPQHDHRQRHAGERRAERARTRRSPPTRTPPTPSRRPTSASAIRTTARPMRCWRSKITTLPAAGSADRQRRRGDGGTVRVGRRHHGRQAGVQPGRQCQWQRLRQLHLPGAGQWRHRQWRRRSRSEPQHDHRQRHAGQRCAERGGQDGHHQRGHRLRLSGGRLRL